MSIDHALDKRETVTTHQLREAKPSLLSSIMTVYNGDNKSSMQWELVEHQQAGQEEDGLWVEADELLDEQESDLRSDLRRLAALIESDS